MRPSLLMAHEPDVAMRVPARVSLQLSGHTHGGQVRLFGWSPIVPSRYGTRFAYGHVAHELRRRRLRRPRLQRRAGPHRHAAGDRAGDAGRGTAVVAKPERRCACMPEICAKRDAFQRDQDRK